MSNYVRAFIVLGMISVAPALAQAPGNWTQAGMLTCRLNPSIGFIIAGHQSMECQFVPSNNVGPPQAYQGALNTVGIDLGISAGGVLGWAVLRRLSAFRRGHLPANMSARPAMSASVSVPAPMS